jgi:YjbE family integral membrane protein
MPSALPLDWGVFEIIWIDILLSGDNAILIALACQQLPERQRRIGILLGAAGGVLLRVLFAFVVIEAMAIPALKLFGAALLLGIAVKLLIDETEHSHVAPKPNLWGAVFAIIMADAVMSLDNVLAIAAAARGSLTLIIFGLAATVPIVMFGAGALMRVLDRFPLLVWAGGGLLGWVAGDMAAGDPLLERFGDVVSVERLETILPAAGLILVIGVAFIYEKLWPAEEA